MRRLPILTPAQRRALLVIEWVLLLGIIGLAVVPRSGSPSKEGEVKEWSRGWVGPVPEEEPFETFSFDPNTADSTALLRLGLSVWQVRSIYRYRARHGRYHSPEDFMRLPGLTGEQWERLRPCIQIDPKYQNIPPPPSSPRQERDGRGGHLKEDEGRDVRPDAEDAGEGNPSHGGGEPESRQKLSPGQTIDISTADTTLLKQIPGIASKRAARIVAYRDALGGFVAVEQAMEATQMPDSVLNYMTASVQPVRKLNINQLSVQQMMKHPYISFYQAKAIYEHRRNHGPLYGVEDLSRLDAFRPTDTERLLPYIEFRLDE